MTEKQRKKLERKAKINKVGVGFFVSEKNYFLVQMSNKKLLQGLYSIPLSNFLVNEKTVKIETINKIVLDWMSLNKINQEYKILGKVNHIFSHFHLNLFIVHIKLNKE